MIQVTFAYLMPDQPAHGTGFYLDGEYAGYIGEYADDDNGICTFVYFYRPFWQGKRIREARGYVMVTGTTGALSLVRRLVARLAYRQLMSRARAIVNSDCAKTFYLHVLESQSTRRGLSYALIDERTWNDPSRANEKSDHAFTPECASQKEEPQAPAPAKVVYRVYSALPGVHPALSYKLIQYTDGSTRRVTAQDIQAGAEPAPATPAFPLVRAACPVSPIQQASTPTRALFLPEAITRSLLNAHRSNAATTTTRNTQ